SYLMYALYDQDSVLYDRGKVLVSNAAANEHEQLRQTLKVKKNGYLETFVVNETAQNIYFDNLRVQSTSPIIVQENAYYPFGMTIAGLDYSYNNHTNRYLYNGKELIEDLNLGLYDYGARMYDPAIGRWITVDPLAHEFPWQSPYSAFNNNPILYIDPDGRAAVNSQGCCGGPFDDLINYAKSKARQAAYDLTVATGKALIQLTTSYVEHKLDQAVNSNDPFTSSVALTTEFVTGLGPAEREFGGSHPFTQSLAESNMTTEALAAFNAGYQDYLAGNREDIPSSYRVDFSYGPGGDTGPFKEFFKDGKFTAAQFTGTANYTFSLDKNGNLNIGVYDTKTEYSFLYHAPGTDRHTRSEGQIMGETTQYYNFTIPLDQVQKRVEE
ncbi:RHS repeat-associated core domain-containing protein, partial [Algoriphagus marincola]